MTFESASAENGTDSTTSTDPLASSVAASEASTLHDDELEAEPLRERCGDIEIDAGLLAVVGAAERRVLEVDAGAQRARPP